MSELLIPSYLRAAILNQRMYPPGSPMVDRPITQVVESLEPILQATDRYTLTNRQGKIFVKGKEVPDAGLSPFLDEHGLQSLTFLRGVTPPEIAQVVLLLSKKKLPDGNVAEWLVEQNVKSIQVDKVTVVEVMEGEVVMKKVDQIFAGVRDFPGLVKSLRESYDMIDKLPDERSKQEVHDHVAHKLAGMDPSLIRDLLENELPKRMEDSGLRNSVMNAMTQEKVHDIFSEIGNWYKQVRDSASSDFEVVEQLNKFKSFLGKILHAPASKKIPFSLYEELLSQGLLDEIPADIEKKSEEESLAAQVDSLLGKPPEELLEPPLRDQLSPTLRKLCEVGLEELSNKLVERIVKNFSLESSLLRQMSIRISRNFLEILAANHKDRPWKVIVEAILGTAERERTGEVYREVAETLGLIGIQSVLGDRRSEAETALSILSRHGNEKNQLIPHRLGHAAAALRQVAEGTVDVFTAALLSDDREMQEFARSVLPKLGENGAPCYVRVIKRSGDVRLRRVAANALAYFGEGSKKLLAAELTPTNSTDVLLNFLSVMDPFATPEMVPRIEFLRNYPDPAVRRRFIHLLVKVGHQSAKDLLIRFLDDGDESVLIDAVRALGDLNHKAAVGRLVDLLKRESTKLLEEVCISLGHMTEPQSVAALSEILESKSGLFKRRTSVEETVRVRAAWALGQIQNKEARDVLSRCLKDPNLQIQTIARHAIEAKTV